ncbi:MAG: TRAP transporter small permease subunit [Oscillospiraceae bacterium]|nr:TRAP transporter small permease subunit [Oscillospiraceae bacterium]
MPKIFTTLDKIRPAYDMTYKIVMFLCKLLLIADILITSYAVLGRYCQQLAKDYPDMLSWLAMVKDPAWTEQIVLTCMSYMAVLSAALAIRTGAHIRMTAFDAYLPKIVVKVSNVIADIGVMALAVIMLVVGWGYASTLGSKGFYESIPWLSRFWMYFPVPLAGIAMIVFELEALYEHIKAFFIKEEEATA